MKLLVLLFITFRVYSSSPVPEGEYVGNIFFSKFVIEDMENKRVTVEEINFTLTNGTCYHSCMGGLLYVDELSKLGVVINKKKTRIINIVANDTDLWLERFLSIKDAAEKKKRIPNKL